MWLTSFLSCAGCRWPLSPLGPTSSVIYRYGIVLGMANGPPKKRLLTQLLPEIEATVDPGVDTVSYYGMEDIVPAQQTHQEELLGAHFDRIAAADFDQAMVGDDDDDDGVWEDAPSPRRKGKQAARSSPYGRRR
jgi:hypothetical protein